MTDGRLHVDRPFPVTAQRVEHYAPSGPLFFYGGMLSSFASRRILLPPGYYGATEITSVRYGCREQWFACCKATNRDDHDYVHSGIPGDSQKPSAVKGRGREIKLRPDWDSEDGGASYRAMIQGMRLEVSVDLTLATFLDATGDRVIAEDSPADDIWGCRDHSGGFTGRNLLGICWMQVRYEARLTQDCRSAAEAGHVIAPYLVELYERGIITTDHDLAAAITSLAGDARSCGPGSLAP